MSKLGQIATFIKVAENSSFALTARSLKLSTAAVSKQISQLEDNLGVQLLYRSTRRVELTEIGKIYFAHCKRIINEVDEADALISQTHQEPFGELRVTAGRHFAERYIVPHLAEFMEHFRKIRISLELTERVPDLEKEGIDILIGMSIPGPADSIQRVIEKTRYVLCASPDYLKKYGTPKRPQDLIGHQYITHSMRRPDDVILFKNDSIHVEPLLRLNDTKAMLQCALEGVGIIKLHEYVVREAIEQKKLVEILSSFAENELSIYLCYQARRYLQPKIRRFIDFVLGKMRHT